MKHTFIILGGACSMGLAAITATKDSSAFTNQYDGNQIWDGTGYVNNWGDATAGVNETLSGTILDVSHAGNTGWIEQNDGASPWETNLTATSAYTFEARLNVNDSDLGTTNVVSLWLGNGANTLILNVSEVGVGSFNINDNLDATANADFVDIRVAYDSADNDFSVWRNDVLLTDNLASNFNDNQDDRLIVGDCCSSVTSVGGSIEHVRYDTSGAFAPTSVPEPSTGILAGLAGMMLLVRRRK